MDQEKVYVLLSEEMRRFYDELKSLNSELKDVNAKLHETRIELTTLKTQAQIAGGIAGFIPALVAVVISYLTHKK